MKAATASLLLVALGGTTVAEAFKRLKVTEYGITFRLDTYSSSGKGKLTFREDRVKSIFTFVEDDGLRVKKTRGRLGGVQSRV